MTTDLPGERMHYCGRCVSGEHELGVDTWETSYCRLQREGCQCECDCPYYRVLIEEPRWVRRRTPRRWPSARRLPRRWAEEYVHEVINPPHLSPEEYLNRKSS